MSGRGVTTIGVAGTTAIAVGAVTLTAAALTGATHVYGPDALLAVVLVAALALWAVVGLITGRTT